MLLKTRYYIFFPRVPLLKLYACMKHKVLLYSINERNISIFFLQFLQLCPKI